MNPQFCYLRVSIHTVSVILGVLEGPGTYMWIPSCHLDYGQRQIFTALADALEWCMARERVQVVNHYYLDNFVNLCLLSSETCAEHLQILHKVCNDLGVPLAPE